MVQVIHRREKKEEKPSFGQEMMKGIFEGAQALVEHKMKQQTGQQEAQNKLAMLEHEYDLKTKLAQETQNAKYDAKIAAMKKAGFLQDENQQTQEEQPTFGDKILRRGEDQKVKSLDIGDKPPRSKEEINKAMFFDANIAKSYQQENKEWNTQRRHEEDVEEKKMSQKRKEFESDRDYHSRTSEPIIAEAQSIIKEAPIKKGLINQQRRDIASGNTEGLIPFLVERTGLEAYRNPESARFKTASKQRFVEALHQLGSAGARANQFIEQQLVSAQPTLGRNSEANQTVLDLEEFVDDMKTQRAKYELELAEQDMKEHGYSRNDIAFRADKKMEKYVEKRQQEMAYDIRRRHEDTLKDEDLVNEVVGKSVTPDTPLTVRMARILMIKNNDDEKKTQAEAKRLGFTFPDPAIYLREMK